ncbi:MAG: response regulator, partial [Acidobacteriota bacterium]
SVVSEEGKGSTFTVSIPFEVIQAELPAPVRPERSRTVAAVSSDVRLLLVEDNPVNQRVVLAMLRKRGYRIDVANNGQEALDMLSKTPNGYQLVLMDVQMPVLDGLEATRIIRRDHRWDAMPVVAMTAHAMAGDRERCLKAGMDAYLSKPLQAAQLIVTIEKLLTDEAQPTSMDSKETAIESVAC